MTKVKTEAYVLREKHDTRVVHASTLGEAALQIVKDRLEEGIYYEDDYGAEEEWLTIAKQIVARGDQRWAQQFLEERQDYEYEGFETKTLEFDLNG